MANDDERLVVLLEARIRDFEKNMQKASRTSGESWRKVEKDAKSSASRLEGIYSGVGKGFKNAFGGIAGAAGIGGLGFAGLIAGAKTASADLANVAAEAKRAGVGVEAFQELGYAAQQSRVGIDALTDGMKELQLRADEFVVTGAGSGAEAFQRLGYTAAELKTKLADPAALFQEVIDKLAVLDKASQIRIADEIFGGTGGEQFVRLLDQGVGSIGRMRQEARDTGNVVSAELIAKAVELDRQFTNIANTISTGLKGAIVSVVSLMREFTDMLRATENQSASTLQTRINLINAAVENARKSSLAFAAIGGETGIASRLAERDELQGQLDSRPGTSITVNAPGRQGDLSKITTPASKAAADLQKAYAGIITGAEQRIAALNVETSTLGMTTRAAEAYRTEQELLAEAQRAGLTLTDAQRGAISRLASAYGDASAAAEVAAAKFQNAEAAKAAFADAGMEGIKGFVFDLKDGANLTDALANSLKRLGDRLLDMGLDLFLSPLLNALSGSLKGLLGFSDGGRVPSYAEGGRITGPGTGTSDSILARVSAGEFVVNAAATSRNRDVLEAINRGTTLPAFATGGSVRAPSFKMPAVRTASAPPVAIRQEFHINASGGTPEQNADLAKRLGNEFEQRMRSVAADEMMQQMRPGGLFNA